MVKQEGIGLYRARRVCTKIISWVLVCILVFSIEGVGVTADIGSDLVLRKADSYSSVDFSQMNLADYCIFFVQDINLKYHEGFHCYGASRSVYSKLLDCGTLQDVAIASLEGKDLGLDCSSFVYLVGKYFGMKCNAQTTEAWSKAVIGTDIESKVDAKANGFSSLQLGDVIITKNKSNGGHAVICVGEINGKMSVVHIGSGYLCDKDKSKNFKTSNTCCTITPGEGVSICDKCVANTDKSGQNKRFPRIASVEGMYESDMDSYNSIVIYRPIYDRSLGGDYTGTDYGTGVSTSQLYSWNIKTGSLREEMDIYGMGDTWYMDGDPINIVGRDGLGMSEVNRLSELGENIGYNKITVVSVSSTIMVGVGLLLLLYALFLLCGLLFDRVNTFVDVSLVTLFTFGRVRLVDEDEAKKSFKKNGHMYMTKTGVIIRAVLVGIVGMFLVSGMAFRCIRFVLSVVYKIFS